MTRSSLRPIHRSWLLVLPIALACSTSPTETAPPPLPPVRLEVLAGAAQSGEAGDSLSFPIDVRLTDQAGTPLLGERVVWSGTNGVPDADTTRTDAAGRTSVHFILGENPGIARLVARLVTRADSVALEFGVRPDTSNFPTISFDPFTPLDLRTYDGSNETVHPDFVATPTTQFLVITPYPGGNRNFENPSFYSGAGAWRWRAPTGLRNPVVPPPASGYLSDPDAVYDPTSNQIFLYYRQVEQSNDIYLTRSTLGVKWSTPVLAASAPRDQLVSPTVVRRSATDWLMWAVDAGSYGCSATSTRLVLRHSKDGVAWGPAEAVTLSADAPMPWHIDVQWIPSKSEYWALYSAKPSGSCGAPAMMFARSPDGVRWAVRASPIVMRGMHRNIADIVYRATFSYEPRTDELRMWISGASGSSGAYTWKTVFERIKAATVLESEAHLSNPWAFTPSLPLLTDGP